MTAAVGGVGNSVYRIVSTVPPYFSVYLLLESAPLLFVGEEAGSRVLDVLKFI